MASACLVGVVLASGCSYRVLREADGRNLTVSVVTLSNDSVEPGLELIVSRALRQEFLRRAAPRLVADPGAADLVIRGRVEPLVLVTSSFSTVSLALEYRVWVTLDVSVSHADRDAIPIDSVPLTESEVYLASADAEAARKNRREALQRIADVLAARIHDAIGLQLAVRAREAEPS